MQSHRQPHVPRFVHPEPGAILQAQRGSYQGTDRSGAQPPGQVLVQKQFHRATRRPTRAACSSLMPSPSQPSTSQTVILSPRTQGWPDRLPGSTVIRFSSIVHRVDFIPSCCSARRSKCLDCRTPPPGQTEGGWQVAHTTRFQLRGAFVSTCWTARDLKAKVLNYPTQATRSLRHARFDVLPKSPRRGI